MKRRDFIKVIAGSAAAWPYAARAQQPAMPVIGFVNTGSPKGHAQQLFAFLKGLGEAGYVDGQNVHIEYRWADGQNDRLPAMVADLVHREVALGARLPTIFYGREHVQAGALMAYGPNYLNLFRRTGELVDKILRGTKPGDIPVEEPTKFELVFNLTTAKALGLTIPHNLLVLADEVIE